MFVGIFAIGIIGLVIDTAIRLRRSGDGDENDLRMIDTILDALAETQDCIVLKHAIETVGPALHRHVDILQICLGMSVVADKDQACRLDRFDECGYKLLVLN